MILLSLKTSSEKSTKIDKKLNVVVGTYIIIIISSDSEPTDVDEKIYNIGNVHNIVTSNTETP